MQPKKTIRLLFWFLISLFSLSTLTVSVANAADNATRYKPFVLASIEKGQDMKAVVQSVTKKLTTNGFTIVGSYMPYPSATIIIVTNDALKQNAASSSYGAFGAIQRIGITKAADGIQVSYTNPVYMANAYQMKSNLSNISSELAKALGREKEFGSAKGLTADDLRDYHYKWLMPYFTDRVDLATYDNYNTAIKTVEKNLKSNKADITQVYRVDIPGKQETVIGLSMPGKKGSGQCSGDEYTMSRIDFKKLKSTAHLPYEIVINGGGVVALPAEFRIAINFPDLSMMGSNSFMSIMCAPDAYKKALGIIAGQ